MKRKIAIGLCLFLTVAPFLGSYYTNESAGEIVGNLTPYIHLTVPQVDGMPFADAIAALFALAVSTIGFVCFLIFAASRFRNTIGLKAFLIIAILYCGVRCVGGLLFLLSAGSNSVNTLSIAGIITDIAWGSFCYWAVKNIDPLSRKI